MTSWGIVPTELPEDVAHRRTKEMRRNRRAAVILSNGKIAGERPLPFCVGTPMMQVGMGRGVASNDRAAPGGGTCRIGHAASQGFQYSALARTLSPKRSAEVGTPTLVALQSTRAMQHGNCRGQASYPTHVGIPLSRVVGSVIGLHYAAEALRAGLHCTKACMLSVHRHGLTGCMLWMPRPTIHDRNSSQTRRLSKYPSPSRSNRTRAWRERTAQHRVQTSLTQYRIRSGWLCCLPVWRSGGTFNKRSRHMSKQRPPQITPVHLAEVAAIYVRVATKPQAHESTGSIESQRNQRLYALAWGWSADQIQLYEDLGRSGTRADNRPAFQRLLTRVRGGQIGAIFCLDAARLSRAPLALEELVALCHLQRTLLVLDGTLELQQDGPGGEL
ncbi:MAG: recombinase family protein [candidate division NC10 bacterium]|nr:recombinase family protein [candidate division NC10 bacterium]